MTHIHDINKKKNPENKQTRALQLKLKSKNADILRGSVYFVSNSNICRCSYDSIYRFCQKCI